MDPHRPHVTRARAPAGRAPRHHWYHATNAMVGVVGVVVGIATSVVAISVISPRHPPPEQVWNTEILVDSSGSVQEDLDVERHTTKLEAVQGAIDATMGQVGSGDRMALRQFGGSCDGPNTRKLVAFGGHRTPQMRQAVNDLRPHGLLTLVRGIVEATSDLSALGRTSSTVHDQIVVITGGGRDACGGAGALTTISERLRAAGIAIQFRFIGVGVRPEEQGQLYAVANAIDHAPPAWSRGTPVDLVSSSKDVAFLLRKDLGGAQPQASPTPTSTPTVTPSTAQERPSPLAGAATPGQAPATAGPPSTPTQSPTPTPTPPPTPTPAPSSTAPASAPPPAAAAAPAAQSAPSRPLLPAATRP
jgi:hypothetical protein